MSVLYAMKERSPAGVGEATPPFPVTDEKARQLNVEGPYGIFRSVNEFGEHRRIECLEKINAWHVEIDGDKPAQIIKINSSPIYPSRIVESKNGYHLYFFAKDACLENYKRILKGLLEYYGGDPRAAMVTVILREPGYLHKKDPTRPFAVLELTKLNVKYSEEEMLYYFPMAQTTGEKLVSKEFAKTHNLDRGTLTEFLDNLDHEYALSVLSGSSCVNGETYSFKPVAKGRKNIIVNGNSTSCFIDENKRIGAVPGGPMIFQWLRYFNHDDHTIYKILKEHFGGKL
jgi:hypothetical protein